MKKIFVSLALAMLSLSISAQSNSDEDGYHFNHFSVGAEVGTTGVGFSIATTATSFLQLRAGMTFMPNLKLSDDISVDAPSGAWEKYKVFNKTYLNTDVGSLPDKIKAEGKLNMTDFHMLADFYPSKTSNFHFTIGFYLGKSNILEAYNTNCQDILQEVNFYNNATESDVKTKLSKITPNPTTAQVKAAYTEIEQMRKDYGKIGADLGDYFLEPDANGNVQAQVKIGTFKPYLGLGFGRAVPRKNRLSFQFEMGCQFWDTTKLYINGEELVKSEKNNDTNEILNYISKTTVYPVIKFRLNGRIL